MRALLSLALLCAPVTALAQVSNPIAPASMPQPSDVLGNAEMVGGAVGSATTYKRGDWVPPRISRAGTCTLSTPSGTCTVTWATAFPNGTTVALIIAPINNTSLPVVCNPTSTPTLTTASIQCWFGRTLPSSLTLLSDLLNYNTYAATATGITVMVIGIPTTQ